MTSSRVSVVIPAYNEGEEIVPVLDRIFDSVESAVRGPGGRTTSPRTPPCPSSRSTPPTSPGCGSSVNTYGRGPANAIRFGIDTVTTPVVVVTMADGSDDPQQIDQLARLVERGVVVAAASRYSAGGQQVGGPMFKGLLSRTAGRSLGCVGRVGTRDATNSFKAYSTEFVREVGIDSRAASRSASSWSPRPAGCGCRSPRSRPSGSTATSATSNFELASGCPKYLRWYRFAFGPALTLEQVTAESARIAALNCPTDKPLTPNTRRTPHV